MSLETYHSKRDFEATPEPRGDLRRRKAGHLYVIQKHAATRLHYDLRLELDGVLKSWAVTKGPSLIPGEKRLAVQVEDHPLDYGTFEGNIPKGSYGAGTVILWDRGSWTPIGDPEKGLAKGHLEFTLQGEKLQGRWHLIRMRGKPRDKRDNWLLIKAEDEFARDTPDILEEMPDSVKTNRTLADVKAEAKAPKTQKSKPVKPMAVKIAKARKAPMPDFIEPMLATLAAKPPASARYIHEIKFDGYRLQAHIQAGRVRLLTRSGLDWTSRFGKPLQKALQALPVGTAIIDGEVVVENDSGASDFSQLQADLSADRTDRFLFYAFDLMYLEGDDLRSAPLHERKALLAPVVTGDGLLRLSDHLDESGDLVLRHACRLSLEGIVSKLRDSPYRTGRSKAWVKSKCSARQEFVIGGFVPSTVSRKAIGSLVLGVYREGDLDYVGRVGTGFSAAVSAELFTRLEKLRVAESPFATSLTSDEARQVRYVRPELVAEVEFRAWTADGHLRHASFRGLREDKPAEQITHEEAQAAKVPAAPKRRVTLTHPDRVYWPDVGVTKEGLADYYTEIWPHIAPWITGRALALLRCPDGIEGQQFFQKHAWKGISPHVREVQDPKDKSAAPLIVIDDLDGLIGLVQSATLEIHPWGSTIADWERPDMLIMDLDPGEGVSWAAVIDAAQELRQRLQDHGLASFVKTSGGKGLHVVSPLKPKADWTAVKAFTKAMAQAMARDDPAHYVATVSKAKRRGKILIDYLRNQRSVTAVAAYSTRARPGAPVSTPIAWSELSDEIGPAWFTLQNVPARLTALTSDPWEGFRAAAALLGTR